MLQEDKMSSQEIDCMDGLVKEIGSLLSKYGITLNVAVRIYEKYQKQSKRLTQCYEDNENIWQYYDSQGKNPCGCGSNCFHYEYDTPNNKIYMGYVIVVALIFMKLKKSM